MVNTIMNRFLWFSLRFLGLLLILLVATYTSFDLIVIVLVALLFAFGRGLSLPRNRWLAASNLVVLGLVGCILYAVLLPKPFTRIALPVVNKVVPGRNLLSPWGVSDSGYRLVGALNHLDRRENVFYPSTSSISELEEYYPIYREETLPPDSSSEAIDRWRKSKAPDDLLDANMDYLLTDNIWESWLTQEEYDTLRNPDNYTLVYESPPETRPHYFLFKVRNP